MLMKSLLFQPQLEQMSCQFNKSVVNINLLLNSVRRWFWKEFNVLVLLTGYPREHSGALVSGYTSNTVV